MSLISLSNLCPGDIDTIWAYARVDEGIQRSGVVAWSFEGNGIRTRATFLQAFRDLGLTFTELPNLLKTSERVEDVAGYLDPFFDLYVIRDADHSRMSRFASVSQRPVINAMSGHEHPCEVLTDAFYIDTTVCSLRSATVCLWGPMTNVFRSWHALSRVLGFRVIQVCPPEFHEEDPAITFLAELPGRVDVVITDGWPSHAGPSVMGLQRDHLDHMGCPALIPTPPFTVGREVLFDPVEYRRFAGYAQKQLLLPVQRAIVRHLLDV